MTLRPVDLTRPFSWDEAIAGARTDQFIKGMFFDDALAVLARVGKPWQRKYVAFKDYTEREYVEVVREAVTAGWPDLAPRDALRQHGRAAFPTLRESMIGRVVFGVLGDNIEAVFGIAAKGYAIASTGTNAHTEHVEKGMARVRLETAPLCLEGYQLGVFEGAIMACKRQPGPARIHLDTEQTGIIEITWT